MTITYPSCKRCNVAMLPSKAIAQTWVGSEDFGGDYGQYGTTMSVGGPGKLIDCLKCPTCGHCATMPVFVIESKVAGVWDTLDEVASLDDALILASTYCDLIPEDKLRISTPDFKIL